MTEQQKQKWQPGKRDLLFLAVIAAVVLTLVLGTSERKTTPLPNDEVHRTSTSKAACMACHAQDGVRPQPPKHTKVDKCLLCHTAPEGWIGVMK
ncbi:MAG: hypothetical protein ACE5E3_00350 [Mariprofundus sp.]